MRIRRCASLLLGAAVAAPAPPRFELPPSSPRFELLPPPAHESRAGLAPKSSSSSSPERCSENVSPWSLFPQLDHPDPQEEERFMETYSVPAVRRASWLLPVRMSACSIKEDEEDMVNVVDDEEDWLNVVNDDEEEEDMAVEYTLEPCVPKDAGRNTARKKKESKQRTRKGKEKAGESDDDSGGGPWTCKKNDGKGWFCRRPVSRPDSLCSYHSEPKLPSTLKPRRKRATAFGGAVGEGFYYYAGFGPSRSKRHRGSSSRSVPEPPPPAAQLPEEHIDVCTGQAQADDADGGVDDEPRCDGDNDDDAAGIAGWNEESSSDEDVKMGKSLTKKRWRKPVKARSVNSLM